MKFMEKTSAFQKSPWVHGSGLLVFLLWALLLLALLVSGRYTLYLTPKFWILLAMGVSILGLFFIAKWVLGESHSNDPDPRAFLVRTSLLVLPLLFLVGGHGDTLGSYAFSKRKVIHGPGASDFDSFYPNGPDGSTQQSMGAPDITKNDVIEIDLLELLWNHVQLSGRKVRTLGQVAWDETAPKDHFVLFRFVIACCVADAQPITLLVHFEDQEEIPEDTWVEVQGVFRMAEIENQNILTIQGESIKAIEEPLDVYLYAF